MPQFQGFVSAEEAATLAAGSVDLGPYTAVVDQLAPKMIDGKFSEWGRIKLAAGETPRQERKRFTAAGAIGKRSIDFRQNGDKTTLYVRIRPAPKPRAAKATGNGVVSVVPPPAPVAPVPEPVKAKAS
jgi:hypothetical protein